VIRPKSRPGRCGNAAGCRRRLRLSPTPGAARPRIAYWLTISLLTQTFTRGACVLLGRSKSAITPLKDSSSGQIKVICAPPRYRSPAASPPPTPLLSKPEVQSSYPVGRGALLATQLRARPVAGGVMCTCVRARGSLRRGCARVSVRCPRRPRQEDRGPRALAVGRRAAATDRRACSRARGVRPQPPPCSEVRNRSLAHSSRKPRVNFSGWAEASPCFVGSLLLYRLFRVLLCGLAARLKHGVRGWRAELGAALKSQTATPR